MDITPDELKQRMDHKEALHIIDVREEWEFEEKNLGGMLIPLGSLPSRIDELAHLKNEEVIVHCRSGARSNSAKQFMISKGFSNVRNLIGGIEAMKG
jgi:rhodanese-related sulfurtransferase